MAGLENASTALKLRVQRLEKAKSMSKVYEALRQKQQETPGSLQAYSSIDEELLRGIDLPKVDGDLQIEDSVLGAAFDTFEDLPKAGRVPDSEPGPVCPDGSKQTIFSNGFRRLSLAKNATSRLIFLSDPHGLAAEQFRFLRRTLEQKFPHGAVLLVTSPAPRDGKTLTSINLSSCLADSGRSTLLVEGDIRQPAVEKALGASIEGPGIEEAFAGAVDPAQTIHFLESLSFYVSLVLNPPADPSRLVSGNGAKQYLTWARERFHWVVIDSPPVLPAVDVAHLATLADAVLLVVRAQSTPRDLLTRAFEMLGDRLSGVVLNEATVESNPYYRYLADYRQKPGASRRTTPAAVEEKKA